MTITEELETHPIFAPFLRMCALMSIGKWEWEDQYNYSASQCGFEREPHTGAWVYVGGEGRVLEVGP